MVRRNYRLVITGVADDGAISGWAELSPSEKAESSYGAYGSYWFRGSFDAATGAVSLQGHTWIRYPEGDEAHSWGFAQLWGTIQGDAIVGSSERGVWAMSAGDTAEETYDDLFMCDDMSAGADPRHPTAARRGDRWLALDSAGHDHGLATTCAALASAAYDGSGPGGATRAASLACGVTGDVASPAEALASRVR